MGEGTRPETQRTGPNPRIRGEEQEGGGRPAAPYFGVPCTSLVQTHAAHCPATSAPCHAAPQHLHIAPPQQPPHCVPRHRINDTEKLAGLRAFASDPAFQAKWAAVKKAKKAKLAELIKKIHGDDVNQNALFDIQVSGLLGFASDPPRHPVGHGYGE